MEKEVFSGTTDEPTEQTREETIVPPPPTYEEAMSSPSSNGNIESTQSLKTYHDLGVALQNLKVETGAQKAEILYVQDNVNIYFISSDGSVTTPSKEPETLKIFILEDDDSANNPKAFLQVGGWIYPLVPGVSPCYRIDRHTFILPDVHSTVEGSSVGLVFPEDTDDSVFELLEDILQGIVTRRPVARHAARRIGEGYSYSISRGIVTGAQYISSGLVRGAQKASELMNYGTPKLIDKINPDPNPREVSPRVSQGLQVAKNVTGTAVQVTGYISSQVGNATIALGRFLAPHIQSQGTKLLSSTCNYTQQEASEKMDGVFHLAAGAVEGFGTIYEGLENSAGILATSLANNTVKIVEHKYGPAVGEATGDYLHTMGNVFVAGNTIRHLTPKSLAKVTAKATGKAVVEDYRNALREDKSNGMNGPGPSTGLN